MRFPLLLAFAVVVLLSACNSGGEYAPDCETHGSTDGLPEVNLDIRRYDNMLAELATAPDSVVAVQKFRQLFGTDKYHFVQWVYWIDSLRYDTAQGSPAVADSMLAIDLYYFAKLPGFRMLRDSISQFYAHDLDFNDIFREPFQRFAQAFPNQPIPRLRINVENRDRTMPGQFAYELYRVNYDTTRNIIAFSLDYFCHADFPSLAPELPRYIRRGCTPEHLAPSVFHELFEQMLPQPLVSQRPTLLDHIVNLGIRNYLVCRMMPCTPDSLLLGFSSEQMQWCLANEKQIYETMLPLLFSQTANEYEPFINTAPFCKIFGQQSPGRIAEFVGLQMVRSYVNRQPETFTLQQLATVTDSRSILDAANYKP